MAYKKSDELIVFPTTSQEEGAKLVNKLNPHYIAGFIDGEGCFAICIGKHKTLKSKREVVVQFEIELRADDRPILERIQATLDCGRIYDLNYDRYGWVPHVKYRISRREDLVYKLIPFLCKYPLQAKKARNFEIFCRAVEAHAAKKHLQPEGIQFFENLQEARREGGKKQVTARVRENRLPSGVAR